MILMSITGQVFTDQDEEVSEDIKRALWKTGTTLQQHGDCLYRYKEDGTLEMYDVSGKPFHKLTLTTLDRDRIKKMYDTFVGTVHIVSPDPYHISAFNDKGAAGTFPMELVKRW